MLPSSTRSISSTRNAKFLPDVVMQQNLTATTDLAAVFQNTEVVFIAIPSVFIQRTLQPLRGQIAPEIVLVNMAKGIDGATGLTSFQTLSGMFPA